MSKTEDDYHLRYQKMFPLSCQKGFSQYNEFMDMRQPEMLKLLEEIDEGYKLAIRRFTSIEIYKLLSQTIEQYRREKMKKIFPSISSKTIEKLEVGETKIDTAGILQERLLHILQTQKGGLKK